MELLIWWVLFAVLSGLLIYDSIKLLGLERIIRRVLTRIWELFAFFMMVIALSIYCLWCWIRGKKPENIFQ